MKNAIYSLAIATMVAAGVISGGCNSPEKKSTDNNFTGQDSVQATPGDSAKKAVKLDKNKVPKTVTDYFISDYPANNDATWYGYGYPQFDYVNNWYDNWYDYGPYTYSEYPDYYIADFSDSSKANNKAVYSKAGNKIAVHKIVSDLPASVSSDVSNSAYKDWTMEKDKEEIFKDKESDQLKVYKVTLEKGKEKHLLYIQQDGQLLKDIKIA